MNEPAPQGRARLSTALIIIGLQILLSVAMLAINLVAEHASGRAIERLDAAETPPGANPAMLPDTAFTPHDLPASFCCGRAPVALRFSLTESDARVPHLAVLVPAAQDNAFLFIDGDLVAGIGSVSGETNMSRRPLLMRVPARYAHAGARVDLVLNRGIGFAHLRPIFVGSYDALYSSYLALRLLRSDLPFANAVIGAFVAAFCFCAAPLLGARGLLFSLSGLAASWALQHVGALMTDPPWGSLTAALLYLFAFLATLAFAVWFFVEWTSTFARNTTAPDTPLLRALAPWSLEARRRLGYGTLALIAVSAPLMALRVAAGDDNMLAIQDIDRVVGYAGLVAMAFCLARLVFYSTRGGLREPIEASAFIFVLIAACVDIAMVRFLYTYGVFLGVAVMFFPLALLVALAGRARSVFEAATATAERLNALVAQREGEILAGVEELQRRERATVLLEERSRIMRDMHDGIGAQLIGLALRARANSLSGESLVQGLEESLAELRLIVDSLDQGEGSLATTLGAFRARIEPRIEAAGARLIWRIENVEDAPAFGPDRALQLYRILQEACTNALKHGRPGCIEVSLHRTAPGHAELTLSDDGAGFQPDSAARGRGLANMRHRAAQIGVTLRVESDATGTRVTLAL